MSTATKTAPLFRVGDWVSYLFGSRRIIGQVVEDRGPLGLRGGRLYDLAIERDGAETTTTTIPEEELEPAPEILPASLATERGFSTQNWPRQSFSFSYNRQAATGRWTVRLKPEERIGGGKTRGAVGYVSSRWESETVDDVNHAIVSVLLEYDPRLSDPRSSDLVWKSMTDEARILADELFKSRHPKARIEPESLG